MNKIIFITGGAKSGKSNFALKRASELDGRKVYIATAEPLDEEMKERIERHKKERGSNWFTVEEPVNISGLIKDLREKYEVLLIDCLTLWLSNIMLGKEAYIERIEELIRFLKALKDSKQGQLTLFIVSNEVGLGIVPDNELARRFRDEAGRLNQRIAEISDEVYFVISGIPIRIKG
ncbi:MAG: bifunctional adenosylcobinamide kinase/adenosylcobinamide-phosphate guanylyltransferase [Thermodesulfovibrionales bacterium]|nr:bifunctional adenosylcobinamide kinase/adenosylcobinamide-phosphate guanylyltransferase [Thermodesulfovibrionales bacterium]